MRLNSILEFQLQSLICRFYQSQSNLVLAHPLVVAFVAVFWPIICSKSVITLHAPLIIAFLAVHVVDWAGDAFVLYLEAVVAMQSLLRLNEPVARGAFVALDCFVLFVAGGAAWDELIAQVDFNLLNKLRILLLIFWLIINSVNIVTLSTNYPFGLLITISLHIIKSLGREHRIPSNFDTGSVRHILGWVLTFVASRNQLIAIFANKVIFDVDKVWAETVWPLSI